MRTTTKRLTAGTVGALMLLTAGCSSETPNQAADTTTNAEPATTDQPTTTLNETDNQTATEAELETLVENWYTFPIDTSKPVEEGMPVQYETGDLKKRSEELVEEDATNLVTRRDNKPSQFRFISLKIDTNNVEAEIVFCGTSNAELIDQQTDLILGQDNGEAWENTAFARLEDDKWLLYDFEAGEALGEENGGKQCNIEG